MYARVAICYDRAAGYSSRMGFPDVITLTTRYVFKKVKIAQTLKN